MRVPHNLDQNQARQLVCNDYQQMLAGTLVSSINLDDFPYLCSRV